MPSISKIKKVILASVFIMLSSCVDKSKNMTASNKNYAFIEFKIIANENTNIKFGKKLVYLMTTKQVRGAAFGGGPTSYLGLESYQVGIMGDCEGAVHELSSIILEAAQDIDEKKEIIRMYYESATCETKKL